MVLAGTSVIVSVERSRTVTTALRPSSMRASTDRPRHRVVDEDVVPELEWLRCEA